MSRSHHKGGEPSQRMLRVGELVRHALAELFSRGDISDPALAGQVVTVSRVKMSPDLKCATAYVLPLGGDRASQPGAQPGEQLLAALDRHRKTMRADVAHKINLKFAPDLRFKLDDGFDNVDRIEALLNSPKVLADTGASRPMVKPDAMADEADTDGDDGLAERDTRSGS